MYGVPATPAPLYVTVTLEAWLPKGYQVGEGPGYGVNPGPGLYPFCTHA